MESLGFIIIVLCALFATLFRDPGECYVCGERFNSHGGKYSRFIYKKPGGHTIHHCCRCYDEVRL